MRFADGDLFCCFAPESMKLSSRERVPLSLRGASSQSRAGSDSYWGPRRPNSSTRGISRPCPEGSGSDPEFPSLQAERTTTTHPPLPLLQIHSFPPPNTTKAGQFLGRELWNSLAPKVCIFLICSTT